MNDHYLLGAHRLVFVNKSLYKIHVFVGVFAKLNSCANKPCFKAFFRDIDFPFIVFGPLLFAAFALLASIFRSLVDFLGRTISNSFGHAPDDGEVGKAANFHD